MQRKETFHTGSAWIALCSICQDSPMQLYLAPVIQLGAAAVAIFHD
jgi:hypothetical protein